MILDTHFAMIATALVATLALARLTRLVVDDDWPPIVKFRGWFAGRVSDPWTPLVECPWCAAPWLAIPQVTALALMWRFHDWSALYWTWWILNGWFAISWLASALTVRDIPSDMR